MKLIFTISIAIFSLGSFSQEGVQLGIEISPAWNLITQKQKTTGLRTIESGYGFNVGIPVKWWLGESLALQSGLTFEYMAFDNRFQNTLISSTRYGSLHLPMMFNYLLSGNWYGVFGGGINYNVFAQSWSGFGVSIQNQINNFQPYGGLGISTLMKRDKGVFEFGAQARYHFLELWATGTSSADEFVSRVLSFDLILRFYLLNR